MDPTEEWRNVLAEDPDLDEVLELLDELREEAVEDGATEVGAPLGAVSDDVLRALVISDDPSVRERLLEPVVAILDPAVEAAEPARVVDGLGLVRAAALRAAAGLGGDPGEILERFLPAALAPGATLADRTRTSYALACAATGFDDAVHELVREPPLAFAPDAVFEADARSFARYVVAAAREDATSDDIAAAWTSFVAFVPVRIETDGLMWSDLLFGGMGAYHRVAGFPAGQVLDLIREFVREMAAA